VPHEYGTPAVSYSKALILCSLVEPSGIEPLTS
jgi:hypothetical protein